MMLLRAQYIPWAFVLGMFFFSGALGNSSEVWESRYLLAKAVIELEHEGQDIHGVVFLKEPFREVAPYHFKGSIEGDVVKASHYSGHCFRGKVVDNGEIAGILTTRTGIRLNLKANRR
ncbi:MAG: hypothetical protein KJ630_03295 [Proteobacteria bacterium]|nr:hypothetical protein [Pseudomonadota bacterium]